MVLKYLEITLTLYPICNSDVKIGPIRAHRNRLNKVESLNVNRLCAQMYLNSYFYSNIVSLNVKNILIIRKNYFVNKVFDGLDERATNVIRLVIVR